MKKVEYKTPSGRLCPYPDMTDDQLDEFEDWETEIESIHKWKRADVLVVGVIVVGGLLLWLYG